MKMFIWADPYHVSYGNSMCFAVANTVEEAKAALATGKRFTYGQYEDGSGAVCDLGEPTRVIDLPCAEWHKWEE